MSAYAAQGPDASQYAARGPDPDDSDPLAGDSGGRRFGNLWGLRNSEPAISPYQSEQWFPFNVEWYHHAVCGFIKQSGSTGAEAWMHYVAAVLILLDKFTDVDLFGPTEPGDSDDSDAEASEFAASGSTEELELDVADG